MANIIPARGKGISSVGGLGGLRRAHVEALCSFSFNQELWKCTLPRVGGSAFPGH